MDNEAPATESNPVVAKPYRIGKALLAVTLLPLLVLLMTAGIVQIFIALEGKVDQSLGFLLTSSSFIVAAVLYILLTGRIKRIWTVLKLRGFKLYHILLGIGGAIGTYMVAILVGMIVALLNQLGGGPQEVGSNNTSETINNLSQSHSLIFLGFLVAILAPVAEEIFFRGALLGDIVQESASKWLKVGAVIVVSVIFGLFHFQGAIGSMADILAMVTPGLVGVTAAILTLKFNSLYPAIFTHLFYNGFVLLIITSSS